MSRSAASGRTAATNRVVVQDIKSSLNFATPGTSRLVTPLACSVLNNGYTLACYVSPNVFGKKHIMFRNNVGNDKMWLNIESNSAIRMYNQELSFPSLVTAANIAQVGKYLHAVVTFDATTGKRVIYVNGTSVATNTTTGTLTLGAESLNIGGKTDVTNDANAKFSNAYVWNRALTADEVSSLYKSGIVPTNGLLLNYKLDEGAGTTAYDSSGNGNHGTITAGTYTADVPTKKRELVGGSMVYNGDFEYAPPTNATGNPTSHRWIDGTLNGSATNALFGWTYFNWAGTKQAYFDDTVSRTGARSMKLSTLATGSSVGVRINGLGQSALLNNIPCKPNTQYSLSGWMKTQVNSGSATSGACFVVGQANELTSVIAPSAAWFPLVNTTTDWTYYAVTFTTSATARYLIPGMQLTGNDGAGTLIMDAWFDDIDLRPTTLVPRGIA